MSDLTLDDKDLLLSERDLLLSTLNYVLSTLERDTISYTASIAIARSIIRGTLEQISQ